MRLAVFLPNWVGDVVMATPALRALRTFVGDGQLVGVMRPYVAEVLAGGDWFDSTIAYSKGNRDTIRQLRAAKLDTVVLLTNSISTAWMAYRSGARERVSMAVNFRSPLLTTKVYPFRRGRRRVLLPTISSYLLVAQAAGAPPAAPKLELATTPSDETLADTVWNRMRWNRSTRVAVLNTGGAFGSSKDWPADRFAEIALRLVAKHDFRVLINCGPKERESARSIVSTAHDPRIVSLADEAELPIGLTKAVIRRASLLVTTDSGPRFFGVAWGVPTVTLFGPTSTTYTNTFSDHETRVSLNLACQPCAQRSCPLKHHRCMQDMTVDIVERAIDAALAQSRPIAA